jgi:hypothetical protein
MSTRETKKTLPLMTLIKLIYADRIRADRGARQASRVLTLNLVR